jgi:hypothetical protein
MGLISKDKDELSQKIPGEQVEESLKELEKPEDLKRDNGKEPKISTQASPKSPVKAEAYKVVFTLSVKFIHGGKLFDKKVGEELTVSKSLKDTLLRRGCVKVL